MLGAIIGDIVGSPFEHNNTDSVDFELFGWDCGYTDDTICTVAVADAILRQADFGQVLHEWCRRYPYPKGGYGGGFVRWVHSDDPQPYNSYGNGSAMRVSPCGWLPTTELVIDYARRSAECTHNHPEGIKGAECVARCMEVARRAKLRQEDKEAVRRLAEAYGYDVGQSCAELRARTDFSHTCQATVPQAIVCFLEGENFEQAIRLAVSIGGDSDTIAAITGSIAEAYYGIPRHIAEEAWSYLPNEMRLVISQFYQPR